MKAMKLMGGNFKEFDSNSTVMVIIEGQQPLGPDAHDYYNEIIRKLYEDPKHIQHIQDFWGDTLTAAGAQSADGKAVLRDDQPGGRAGPDPGQRRRRVRQEGHRGDQGPAGRAGLRRRSGRTHRRSARHRQRQPRRDHLVHAHRDRRHAADRLPLDRHHVDPAVPDVPRIADCARSGVRACHPRGVRADDVRGQHPDDARDRRGHRLRHLHLRALSRRPRHRAEQGRLVLRHVHVRRTRHRGLGPDDRRSDLLPQLHAAALLRHDGRPGRDRHGRGRRHCGHARTGGAVPG